MVSCGLFTKQDALPDQLCLGFGNSNICLSELNDCTIIKPWDPKTKKAALSEVKGRLFVVSSMLLRQLADS